MKQEVTVDGLKININIEESGSGDTTLLMVHGIPTNARLWRHVQAQLPQYRTLAMDMVGYGQSDMPLDKFKHSFMNQAEAVKGVIDGLGLKGKVILVAHDHGGGVAQVFATKYCDYISRLVLINPVCFDQWPVCEVEALAGLDGAPDEVLMQALPQAVAGFPALMRMGSYDGAPFTDKNCKQNYLQFWGRGPDITGFKSLIRISADPQNSDTDVDHSKITCPTMVMWGVADNFMSCTAAEKLKERITGPTRVQYIERAGHWVQEDRPDEVAKYINDFVSEWAGVNL